MTSTRTAVRAGCFSARRCAVVAPTFPAPTTVILLNMDWVVWRHLKLTSPAARVHLPVRVGAQRLARIQCAAPLQRQALLGAAIAATAPDRADQSRELRVAGARAQRLAQIDALPCVQAQEPGAICREP